MPFLGQDWRAPGEHWVKDKTGNWSRMDSIRRKLLVNLYDETYLRENMKLIKEELNESMLMKELEAMRPHAFIILKEVTREQTMRTQIAEALVRLDVADSVKDIKKFNYVTKLMLELIKNKMTSLSGTAQKNVMNVVEQIVVKSQESDYNKRAVRELLNELQAALIRGENDHVGSCLLWEEHQKHLDKLREIIEKEPGTFQSPTFHSTTLHDLPDELLRLILLRLADHVDLVNLIRAFSDEDDLDKTIPSEETADDISQQVAKHFFYKQLCLFHFPDRRVWSTVLRRNEKDIGGLQWETLFIRLIKRYGPKEVYADMLHLCRHCNALFWKVQGHPCCINNVPPASRPVPPNLFADLFSA